MTATGSRQDYLKAPGPEPEEGLFLSYYTLEPVVRASLCFSEKSLSKPDYIVVDGSSFNDTLDF